MAREKTKMITSIGGQAVMEGVMMQGPHKTALAVRMPDNTVSTEEIAVSRLRNRYSLLRLPILRGVAGFIDALSVGYKALSISAEKSGLEDDEQPSKFDQWMQRVFGDKLMNAIMTVSAILGVLIAVGLFFWLPTWLFNMGKTYLWGPGFAEWRTVFEGFLKIAIFIAYIAFCASLPDIKRVFQYHGAEHKTIFCYENEEELTVENVRGHQRFHPRCGTSFMVIMLLLGIVAGYFIPFTNPFVRTVAKLLCVPLLMGIGYELIRICGKYDNLFTRIISAPGMWMQRLTTKEPDDSMIEVAISAMKEVIPENGEDRVVR
ncbi:DUF1385 domain-containing protein [Faecalispora jeddahensis]|uniref:DUF1385 domain-containing protein n=1 Tax=Faecalispora jeddahensis TaxID=1414721 RepID=UPI0004B1550A|nr:DUF1385 domain-containing protein [Faecalispora jeddahensis]